MVQVYLQFHDRVHHIHRECLEIGASSHRIDQRHDQNSTIFELEFLVESPSGPAGVVVPWLHRVGAC